MFIDILLIKIADMYYNPKLKNGSIEYDDFKEKDIVFRQNLYNVLITILSLFFGYILGIFFYTLIFYVSFNILRIFSNGYHSYGNVTYCAIMWLITTPIIIFIAINTTNMYMYYMILNIIFYFYLYDKTPYANNADEKIELDNSSINHKLGVAITYILFLFISFILSEFNMSDISNTILLSNLYVVFYMNNYVNKMMSSFRRLIFGN